MAGGANDITTLTTMLSDNGLHLVIGSQSSGLYIMDVIFNPPGAELSSSDDVSMLGGILCPPTRTGIETGVCADQTNNDFVDLSGFYNLTTLAQWNAANPGQAYAPPLQWLQADLGDGVLQQAGGLRVEYTNVVCFAGRKPPSVGEQAKVALTAEGWAEILALFPHIGLPTFAPNTCRP